MMKFDPPLTLLVGTLELLRQHGHRDYHMGYCQAKLSWINVNVIPNKLDGKALLCSMTLFLHVH